VAFSYIYPLIDFFYALYRAGSVHWNFPVFFCRAAHFDQETIHDSQQANGHLVIPDMH
jgi:hypothetical protein